MNNGFVLGHVGVDVGGLGCRASFMKDGKFSAPKQAVGCWGHLSTSLGALRLSSPQNAGADSFDPAPLPGLPASGG